MSDDQKTPEVALRHESGDLEFTDEMRTSYLEYSLAVIQDRALPDIRDGLKPVQRRVLFAMKNLGLLPSSRYKKCANIVGNVMGHYHPHGDLSIYSALVLLSQDFRLRVPLIDGQGNFGSLEDPPAAMRYVEAKLSAAGALFFEDSVEGVVDFKPNFDGSKMQPTVLASPLPNLLINGCTGIAVGMSTLMLPHNPGEALSMVLHLLDNPKATIKELMKHLPAPDFPSGGVVSKAGLVEAYTTGRGKVSSIGKLHVEQLAGNREQVVITELPHETNKSTLLVRIRDLYLNGKFDELADMKDESGRDGIRIILRLKRGVDPRIVEAKLRKETTYQKDFPMQMTVLINQQPRVVNLQELGVHFLEFRREVIANRTKKRLGEVKERLHILEAYLAAITHVDEVVKIIKNTPDLERTKERLKKLLTADEKQVDAILAMRLQRIGNLDRNKYKEEEKNLRQEEKELKSLLASKKKINDVIRTELTELKKKFSIPRSTEIKGGLDAPTGSSGVEDQDVLVSLTSNWRVLAFGGSVKRSGLGVKLSKNESIVDVASGKVKDDYLIITDHGNAYRLHGSDLYVSSVGSSPQSALRRVKLKESEEKPVKIILLDPENTKGLCFVTKQGQIKKTSIEEFMKVHASGVKATSIGSEDELLDVLPYTEKDEEIVLVTSGAKILRFSMSAVREMGRAAGGVKGIQLRNDDEVVAAQLVQAKDSRHLVVLAEGRRGKRITLRSVPIKGRGTQGISLYKVTPRTGKPLLVLVTQEEAEICYIAAPKGSSTIEATKNIPLVARANAPRNLPTAFNKLYKESTSEEKSITPLVTVKM